MCWGGGMDDRGGGCVFDFILLYRLYSLSN